MKKNIKVIISGGGTGGHIFPAISIADAVKEKMPDAEILFVGAEGRMEMEKVPAAGYKIIGIPISGLSRTNIFKNFKVIAQLFKSLKLARKIIKEFKPDVAVGVGGYASGPTLWSASGKNIPIVIQEQNSYAGVTNKLLSKKADAICVAYEGMERFFPAENIILTGNPVRKDLTMSVSREEAIEYFGLDKNKKTILAIGGSLGARTINESIIDSLKEIPEGIQIIWQSGKFYDKSASEAITKAGDVAVKQSAFITRMDYAYAAADLVISRAGASSISELCLLGKASILVPSPNVAEDHQTKNAMALSTKDAAILVPDAEANISLMHQAFSIVKDERRVKNLSENIKLLAQKESASRIADIVIEIAKKRGNE
ncbi:MAG: undecaprenyldiphospho-muramoylpentapeptide beta-N-acetylglucosaminyltransferase [Bacteroidales bacterium]|nr:undecaprenyldiphospho-muramoylpentapeptide beta-N-acetylglucosaminyltransferase [Bacteroidales bacterium]